MNIAFPDQLHPAIRKMVEDGLPSDWHAIFAASRDARDQAQAVAAAEAIFVIATPVRAPLIERAPRLRLIHKLGAGTDNIDTDVCRARNITVAKLDGGNAAQVAEHTLLMMLAACRRLPQLDKRTRAGEWLKEDSRGQNRQIFGKKIGLVGCGAIGQAVARLLMPFGATVVYFDPRPLTPDVEQSIRVAPMDLDQLLEACDIVSLHLPLMRATAGIIDAARIRRMKPGAILVNCARGGLVDEGALYDALRHNRLFAAALDTFAKEPPVGSPLLELSQTVITPHVSGATVENFLSVLTTAIDNTMAFFAGERLPQACTVVSAC